MANGLPAHRFPRRPPHVPRSLRGLVARCGSLRFPALPLTHARTHRSVDDLELGARVVFGHAAPGEQYLAPLPYRDPDMPQRLRFGYYLSGTSCPAAPAVFLPLELRRAPSSAAAPCARATSLCRLARASVSSPAAFERLRTLLRRYRLARAFSGHTPARPRALAVSAPRRRAAACWPL